MLGKIPHETIIVLDRIVGFLHKDSQFRNKFFQREGTLSKVVKLPHYYKLIGVWLDKISSSNWPAFFALPRTCSSC